MELRIEFSSSSMVNRISQPVHALNKFTDIRFSKLYCLSGGGFTVPARPDYFPFLRSLQKDVSASLGDIGVAFLEYCKPRPISCPSRLTQ